MLWKSCKQVLFTKLSADKASLMHLADKLTIIHAEQSDFHHENRFPADVSLACGDFGAAHMQLP